MSGSVLPIVAGAVIGFGVGAFSFGLKSKDTPQTLDVPKPSTALSKDFSLKTIHAANVEPKTPKLGLPGPPLVWCKPEISTNGSVTVREVVKELEEREAYVLAYDRRTRIPAWTAEHLTADVLTPAEGTKGNRAESVFKEDESVPAQFRAHLTDYYRSGYDRGHMVPAADAKKNQTAMNETFYLSNIAPQVGEGFNRHYWAYLESFCRNLAKDFQDVYVFTVPLFLPRKFPDNKWRVSYEVIGESPNVAVPTHFAKVVLARKPLSGSSMSLVKRSASDYSLAAFVLPNDKIPDETPLLTFVTPVDAVEHAAGLSLVPEEIKKSAHPLCMTTSCQLTIRRFDDARKKLTK